MPPITGKIERADLEEAVKHKRGGDFFKRMGTPPKAISLREYVKFFFIVRKVKGEEVLAKLMLHVEKEVPVPVDRIVEKFTEVPVERIVYKEVPVEVRKCSPCARARVTHTCTFVHT